MVKISSLARFLTWFSPTPRMTPTEASRPIWGCTGLDGSSDCLVTFDFVSGTAFFCVGVDCIGFTTGWETGCCAGSLPGAGGKLPISISPSQEVSSIRSFLRSSGDLPSYFRNSFRTLAIKDSDKPDSLASDGQVFASAPNPPITALFW